MAAAECNAARGCDTREGPREIPCLVKLRDTSSFKTVQTIYVWPPMNSSVCLVPSQLRLIATCLVFSEVRWIILRTTSTNDKLGI